MLANELWLQQFRTKRRAYNVSQSKLAALIGITREWLNKIEKGKANLTDDLKEALLNELERFNPNEPLNIMFDYVRIRFSGISTEYVIQEILKIKIKHFLHEDYAYYGYTEHYYLGDIQIMYSENTDMGVLLELKGRGCRQFESYLQAQGRDWYDFFVSVKIHKGITKRIDLAINDNTGMLNVAELIRKSENEECISLFRSFKTYRSGELVKSLGKIGFGDTLYLGSRTSEIHFCIYEKDYEQYSKFGIDIGETREKNRFEIRLRNTRAQKAIDDYLSDNEIKNTVFKIINRYLRFVDRTTSDNRQRMKLDKNWEMFLGNCKEKLSLTVNPEPYSFAKSLKWIKKQIAPTLKTAMALDRLNDTKIVDDIIQKAKISEKHKSILDNHVTSIFDMITIKELEKENIE